MFTFEAPSVDIPSAGSIGSYVMNIVDFDASANTTLFYVLYLFFTEQSPRTVEDT